MPIKVEQKSKVIPEVPKIEINCRGLFTISHQAPRVVKPRRILASPVETTPSDLGKRPALVLEHVSLIAFGRSNAGILMSSGTLKSRAAPRAA